MDDFAIDDIVRLNETLHDPTVDPPVPADADSAPTVKVFKDGSTSPLVTTTLSKRGSYTGEYHGQVSLALASGFTVGSSYVAITEATVNGVSGKTISAEFRITGAKPYPTGTVVSDAANAANAFKTDLVESTNDHYNGAFLQFTSGHLATQVREITDYNGASKFVQCETPFTSAPTAGDTFTIINR